MLPPLFSKGISSVDMFIFSFILSNDLVECNLSYIPSSEPLPDFRTRRGKFRVPKARGARGV